METQFALIEMVGFNAKLALQGTLEDVRDVFLGTLDWMEGNASDDYEVDRDEDGEGASVTDRLTGKVYRYDVVEVEFGRTVTQQ